MTLKEAVLEEVEHLPDECLDDVFKFIQKLKEKSRPRLDTALASEAVLARDWLSEEEEEAWRDL